MARMHAIPLQHGSLASDTTGVTFRLEEQLGSSKPPPASRFSAYLRQRQRLQRKQVTSRQMEALAEASRVAAQEREARLALADEIARLRLELESRSKP
jgi:hypothetical protein